jgi:hypothetical protein
MFLDGFDLTRLVGAGIKNLSGSGKPPIFILQKFSKNPSIDEK